VVNSEICVIDDVVKDYGNFRALHGINLRVAEGEFVALVGPSGSGKSTLLQIISGFEDNTSGTIQIDGVNMNGVPPAERPTSMVFQKLALFPHKTVAENIGFSLKIKRVTRDEIARRVLEMLELMELKPEYLTRYPAQLSGGEQQRVALARSMISQPKILLLDEPLSALDVKLKKVLQAELKRLHRTLGVTFVHVTHDLEEAMMLADHICVMKDGMLLQVGTPDDIYYRPTHKFVAEFIGETNLFPVTAVSTNGTTARYSIDGNESLSGQTNIIPGNELHTNFQAFLMIRPEFIRIQNEDIKLDMTLTIKITEMFNRGSTTQVKAVTTVGLHLVTMELQGHLDNEIQIGTELKVGWLNTDSHLIVNDNGTEQ